MGLRCTAFGHKWGDVEVHRDREEDGDEVVVTVREARTCDRCGAEDVLGESMEVTAIEPSDAEPAATGREHPAGGERAGEPGAGDAAGGPDEQPRDPADDDGVILEEDDGDSAERDPREWPDRPDHELEDEGPDEPSPWPDSAKEPEDDEPTEERFVGADEREAGDRDDGADAEPDPADGTATDEGSEPAHGVADDVADGREAAGGAGDELEPDDDGIIEAGGAPEDETAPDDHGASGADEVHVPAADPERGDASPAGDGTVGDAPSEEDRVGGTPAESSPGVTEADDDAELLEETERNEQSRVTAEEPVDPSDPAAHEDAGVGGRAERGGSGRESAGGSTGDQAGVGGGEPSTSDGPSLDPSEPPSDAEPAPEDVEYYCPECGYVDDSKWPSRRAGDICPDCQRSYLAERKS